MCFFSLRFSPKSISKQLYLSMYWSAIGPPEPLPRCDASQLAFFYSLRCSQTEHIASHNPCQIDGVGLRHRRRRWLQYTVLLTIIFPIHNTHTHTFLCSTILCIENRIWKKFIRMCKSGKDFSARLAFNFIGLKIFVLSRVRMYEAENEYPISNLLYCTA